MAKKRQKQGTNRRESGGSSELGRRMKQICDKVWGGDVREMAEDLDVSHPVLYRVFSKGQSPPGVLIERLAVHPKVNRDWLFTGQGVFDRGDWKLPIATEILPGDPRRHAELLTPRTFPVASDFARPTRYFFEVQPKDYVVRSETMKLSVGDLLLMETDRDTDPQYEDLHGRLCGVCVQGDKGVQFKLGQLCYTREEPEADAASLAVDTFDSDVDRVEEVGVRMASDGTMYPFQRTLKKVQYRGRERLVPAESPEGDPVVTTIAREAIVCVCVLLVRKRFRWDA
jgi:hypothetical protein